MCLNHAFYLGGNCLHKACNQMSRFMYQGHFCSHLSRSLRISHLFKCLAYHIHCKYRQCTVLRRHPHWQKPSYLCPSSYCCSIHLYTFSRQAISKLQLLAAFHWWHSRQKRLRGTSAWFFPFAASPSSQYKLYEAFNKVYRGRISFQMDHLYKLFRKFHLPVKIKWEFFEGSAQICQK